MEFYVSRLQSKKVCAFVDSQGFSFQKDLPANDYYYLPRELSFVGYNGTEHLAYNVSISEDLLSDDQRRSYNYQMSVVHGINLYSPDGTDDTVVEKFERDILRLYNEFKTEDRQFLGVKNQYVARILKKHGIKFINYATPFVQLPSIKDLDKIYNNRELCPLHRYRYAHYICSLRKAKHYFKWLSNHAKAIENE